MSKFDQRTRALVALGIALVMAAAALPALAGTTGKIICTASGGIQYGVPAP